MVGKCRTNHFWTQAQGDSDWGDIVVSCSSDLSISRIDKISCPVGATIDVVCGANDIILAHSASETARGTLAFDDIVVYGDMVDPIDAVVFSIRLGLVAKMVSIEPYFIGA